jgi:hypothetical protein
MPSLKTRKCPEGNEFLYVDFDELKKHTKNIITFGSYYSIAQAA